MNGKSEKFNIVLVRFNENQQDIVIIPNRVSNNLRIEFDQSLEDSKIHMFNMEGRLMQSYLLEKNINVFETDVSNLSTGQYIIRYINVNKTITKKFIKI